MNYSLYLFGTNKGVYIQYPSDGEESFLQPLCQNVKGTQLTVYRKESLFHYAFLRQLTSDSSQVFGMCLVTNGLCFEDIKILYQVFDKIFSQIVFSGKILRLEETGKISYISEYFASDKSVIEQTQVIVDDVVQKDLEIYSVHSIYNFSGFVSTKILALEEPNSVLLAAIDQNNVVHIYSNDNSTSSINYVEQTISNLYNENVKLKSDYGKLQSQKKQYRNVIFLILLILACCIGLYFLNGSLKDTEYQLSNANDEIHELEDMNDDLNYLLDNTRDSLRQTCDERDEAIREKDEFKRMISASVPIIIHDIKIANVYSGGTIETDYGNTIYSSSTMYLQPKISYTGIRTGESIELKIRFYTPSGMSTGTYKDYSYSYSMYVKPGMNSQEMSGWGSSYRGKWSSGSYRFEIWCGNVCLGSKSFYIY